MSTDSPENAEPKEGVSRRDFLRVGSLSVVGLSMAEQRALAEQRGKADRRSCIFLLMTGGASQLETFDPKPDAPSHIRGPLKSISTAISGVAFSESLPRLAERVDRMSVIRSLHHDAPAIHETGYQLLHTGGLSTGGERLPGFGSVIASTLGPRDGAPPYIITPRLLGNTGVNMYRGQTAGDLGAEFDPVTPTESETGSASTFPKLPGAGENTRRRYGNSRIGDLCLQARQLVEAGVRCVVVNLFDRLQDGLTWDCHGKHASVPGTLFDYRDTLCPQFDQGVAALVDDLTERGLLDDTLVVAAGEFGRTPKVNEQGGRDHWPGVWSALVAGGGTPAGTVIGCSDAHGTTPIDQPVTPTELRASILHFLNPTLAAESHDDPPTDPAEVIAELLG